MLNYWSLMIREGNWVRTESGLGLAQDLFLTSPGPIGTAEMPNYLDKVKAYLETLTFWVPTRSAFSVVYHPQQG